MIYVQLLGVLGLSLGVTFVIMLLVAGVDIDDVDKSLSDEIDRLDALYARREHERNQK